MFANSGRLGTLVGIKHKELTDTQWERLQPLLPPQKPRTGRPNLDHRRLLNGILWLLRTGAPWRDLPKRCGSWRTVASRFYRWRRAGIWRRLFEAVQQQADAAGQLDWAIHYVDGTIVRAHQHAAGSPKGAEAEALGRSQGGFSTKIHLRAAGDQQLMTFVLTPSATKPLDLKRSWRVVRSNAEAEAVPNTVRVVW